MVDNNLDSFDKGIHFIPEIEVDTAIKDLHSEFNISTIVDFLLDNYGDLWMYDSQTKATDYIKKSKNKILLYNKVFLLLENIRQKNRIIDEKTGLISACAIINTSKGYVVIRDAFFYINPMLFTPFKLKSSGRKTDKLIGLIIEDADSNNEIYGLEYVIGNLFYKRSEDRIILSIDSLIKEKMFLFFRFKRQYLDIVDDIGESFYDFTKNPTISKKNISDTMMYKSYPLVGTYYYAPLTTRDEIDCLLYAELDNQYDDKAIKILRWFPCLKEQSMENSDTLQRIYHVHVLGHISRDHNRNLHDEMCKTNNRLLFGKIENDNIRIVGNLQAFMKNGEYSLYWLPRQLYDFITK